MTTVPDARAPTVETEAQHTSVIGAASARYCLVAEARAPCPARAERAVAADTVTRAWSRGPTGVRSNAHASRMPRRRGRSWLAGRTERAVVNRRVFPYLALVTLGLGVLAGFVVTLVDKKDFPSFGDGVWWAIVTLGTVGYGDIVPHTAWGRVVGSIVIVFGVTFIAFLTATVTSAFVSAAEEQAREQERQREEASEQEMRELLRVVKTQLDAIEAKLDGRS